MTTSAEKSDGGDFESGEVLASHFGGARSASDSGFMKAEEDSSETGFHSKYHSDEEGGDVNAQTAGRGSDYEPASEPAYNFTNDDGSAAPSDEKNNDNDSANGRLFDRTSTTDEADRVEKCTDDVGGLWHPESKSSGMDLDGEILANSHRDEYLRDSGSSFAAKPTPLRNHNPAQDEFVKSGARVKSILTSALQAVADGFLVSNTAANSCGDAGDKTKSGADRNGNDAPTKKTWHSKADFVHMQELAQERAEECMALKRKLEESRSQIEVLQSDNAASEQTTVQLKAKIDRTLEALQIAGTNAANARAEADASNARAESLSGQLNELQSVIEETKHGMEAVRREHDEVSRAARSVEGRLIQVESELIRAARAKKDAVEDREFLKARAEKSERLTRSLEIALEEKVDEVRMLKKDLLEMEELEKARSERTHRIESEFQEARSGLLEASSAAAEAESTVASLSSIIEELRRENEALHGQIKETRDNSSKEKAKQNESLILAEREAQKWKLKVEEGEEEIRHLKMDKTSAEKQVDMLKSRVANMERRLNDSSKQYARTEENTPATSASKPLVTPGLGPSNGLGLLNSLGAKDGASVVSESSNKRKYVSELPQRESVHKKPPNSSSRRLSYSYQQQEKEKQSNAKLRCDSLYGGSKRRPRETTCCLCLKDGGMILSCQCDDVTCPKRAHAICIAKFRKENGSTERTILCNED